MRSKRPLVAAITEPVQEPTKGKKAIDALLDDLGDAPLPNAIIVTVGKHHLMFRYPENARDWDRFEREGRQFIEQMSEAVDKIWSGKQSGLPPAFESALADDPAVGRAKPELEDIGSAYTLHYWSHPDEKIDQPQAIRIVRRNWTTARGIIDQIFDRMSEGQKVFSFAGVMDKKKGSKQMEGSERSSLKPPYSMEEDTPTS